MVKYRKYIRLKGFDYSQSLYYFVTICTDFRKDIFVPRVSERYGYQLDSDVVAGLVPANPNEAATRAATTDAVWEIMDDDLPERFPGLENDFYIFMPNHLHWIVTFSNHKGCNYKLPDVVGAFKSLSTHAVWKLAHKGRLWQPNYYEHIIRSEDSLDRIRDYILQNPWIEYDEINWKTLDPSM